MCAIIKVYDANYTGVQIKINICYSKYNENTNTDVRTCCYFKCIYSVTTHMDTISMNIDYKVSTW